MGLFTRYAMDALMKTSHPEVIRRQCWNLHPHRTPCTACKDICPYGDAIFTRPNLVKDWDPCTDCGLCVSACRSGCIVPSPEQVQRDTSLADTDNDTLWLGCEKSTRKNTAVRTCIASFSWEALAYEQDEAPYHVQELSRREMFSHMTEGSRAGTKKLLQMLPGLRSEEDSAADFRLMLHQRTKQLKAASETPLRYGWYLPNFTQKCFGCGKCEKACRSGALKLEDMPDGQTRVVVTPWKCSECGVCVAACSNSGIDGMKLRQLTTLGPVSVYKCSKTLCADCGKPIAPNSSEGICSVCRIKRRTKQRQEEAAARAKERIAEREARKAAEEAAKAAAAELAAENAANASGAAAAETAAVPVSAAPAAAAATAVSVAETASAPEKD